MTWQILVAFYAGAYIGGMAALWAAATVAGVPVRWRAVLLWGHALGRAFEIADADQAREGRR